MTYVAPTAEPNVKPPPPFWGRFTGVILRPRETFARMTDADAWFWPAIMLLVAYTLYVLAVAVGTVDYMQLVMREAMRTSAPRSPSSATAEQIVLGVVPPMQVFAAIWQGPLLAMISWAVRTALFYGLATLLGGGRPSWGRAASMVGWAWVPFFLQYCAVGLLMLAVPAVSAFFLPLPKDFNHIDTRAVGWAQWQAQTLLAVSPFALWNAALCTVGVAEVFRLPRWKAALIVVVPVALQLAGSFAWVFFTTTVIGAAGPQSAPTPNAPAN